jgi:hypothetical protein
MIEYHGKVYDSIKEAERTTGDKYTTIYNRLKAAERKTKRKRVRTNHHRQKNYELQAKILKGDIPK